MSRLVVKRHKSIAIRPRIFMLGATLVMYLASGTHWILNCYTLMREIKGPEAWAALPVETVYRWSLITTIALFFSVRERVSRYSGIFD